MNSNQVPEVVAKTFAENQKNGLRRLHWYALGAIIANIVLSGFIGMAGCFMEYDADQQTYLAYAQKTLGIERVMTNSRGNWTFWIRKASSRMLVQEYYNGTVNVFDDVPAHDSSWYQIKYRMVNITDRYRERWLDLHIHSAKEINGAGWTQRQKGGDLHGQNIAIE